MWLLRCGRKNRWENRRADDPLDVAAAAKDLTLRPGEDGLSLFEVVDEDDGKRIATLFGVHRTLTLGRSDHVDYILIPADLFGTFRSKVVTAPDPGLGPHLSSRHRQAKGITDAIAVDLAASILNDGRFKVDRVKKQDVEEAARKDPTGESTQGIYPGPRS
jgi:hypothetical protein